ncbi:hypothetical protein [Sinorhizobium alkalisoli]|uniref:hypothetical protein n=1 Tax=Sinorhizobium alkalisoli TaxID=1752398 RepID=UPI0012A7C1B6|nr:hypothetical protein [Sinorhizobium alkalisoli]QFI66373.1 hypothetical protein EKH55_1499 [Sinorhizobium alkalisoli]
MIGKLEAVRIGRDEIFHALTMRMIFTIWLRQILGACGECERSRKKGGHGELLSCRFHKTRHLKSIFNIVQLSDSIGAAPT